MLPFVERTLVLVKPDAVLRGLTGEILSRFERAGLAVIAIKLAQPSIDHARAHYPISNAQLEQMGNKTLSTYQQLNLDPAADLGTADAREIGRMIHEWNAEYLASGPVVACVLEGVHAVKKVRSICGATLPREAAPGTIRGDFSSASPAVANVLHSAVYNLVHASDNENDPDEPMKEIDHWFSPDEIVDYSLAIANVMFRI